LLNTLDGAMKHLGRKEGFRAVYRMGVLNGENDKESFIIDNVMCGYFDFSHGL
jgi:hypothetical protein